MKLRPLTASLAAGLALVAATPHSSAAQAPAASPRPWMNPKLSPDRRAAMVLARMTIDEKVSLLSGYFATSWAEKKYTPPPEALDGSAGYVPGIPRLGIPPQWQTDAGIGVASQGAAKQMRERTALPSGLATAATWNPDLAFRGGSMIGAEARASGFNVMLAGGVNLVREPRNGRNFEYGGEDPLLAGVMVGAQIRGIQSNHIVSTIKHFALNDQETNRNFVNVRIDADQARMSDLLAFEFAIEQSDPGSVMCAYNKVDGDYACENRALLTDLLRRDWAWKGYVMSDWGAVHSTAKAANAGLEQQSGRPFDVQPFFAEPLKQAVANGEVTEARLNEMTNRILRTLFAKGVVDHPVGAGEVDYAAHAEVTRRGAEEGAVLLRNQGSVLPLKAGLKRIALIGGHADKGVLAGGGSSLVRPVGGNAVPGLRPTGWPGPVMYYPSSPMAAIKAQATGAVVDFADGTDPAAAARLAAESDVAIVFVTQWTTESIDASLNLRDNQDVLVQAVARANPRTVVVLETGGPVLMPWIDDVAGVLEAWYPGTSGGEAIANILFGKVNPSGRLPVTFLRDETQLVHDNLRSKGADGKPEVAYSEGATVGYKWHDAKRLDPLFPFGYGLSYTSFAYDDLRARLKGGDLIVTFRVRNTGARSGMDVPQVYVSPEAGGWEAPKRLGGWKKVRLEPGASAQVQVRIDPRLLSVFSSAQGGWRLASGQYKVQVGASSRDLKLAASVRLPERRLPATFDGQLPH